jgi:quercetin dioxygenase-like cupin family protein
MRTYKVAGGNPHDEQQLVIEEAKKKGVGPDRAPKLFTGTVWGEVQLPREEGACSNYVTFAPGARSTWHSHTWGQMMYGRGGNGMCVTRKGGVIEVARLYDGVVIHVGPNEDHFHAAMPDSFMRQLSCELGGEIKINEEVTDSDYAAAVQKARSL